MSTWPNMNPVQSVGVAWDNFTRSYTVTTSFLAAGERMYVKTSFQSATDAIDTITRAVKSMTPDGDWRNSFQDTCLPQSVNPTSNTTQNP